MSQSSTSHNWTESQLAQLSAEYERIGIAKGTMIPQPNWEMSAAEFIAFAQSVPSGAGFAGWVAAMSSGPTGKRGK